MDYKLDREIRLLTESEYHSLYRWYLQEFFNDGIAVGDKLIPWGWTVYFLVTEINYIHDFRTEPNINTESHKAHSEWLHAIIRPYNGERPPTRFSMLGTGRELKQFGLIVRSLESDESHEICCAWSTPSYEFEVDFRNSVADDQIEFTVYLKPRNYSILCNMVKNKSGSEALVFSARCVHGLYASWSPSISADFVKIFTSEKEQIVHRINNNIELPRLGEVSEFSLFFKQQNVLVANDYNTEVSLLRLNSTDSNAIEKARGEFNAKLLDRISCLQTLVTTLNPHFPDAVTCS